MVASTKDIMSITSVRTSRRTMFGGLILCVFSIIGLMVVKDMNEKLSVMTSSNSGYQKMTDSQTNRISQLNSDLKKYKKQYEQDYESYHKKRSELETKLAKSERQVKQLTPYQDKLSHVENELETFKQKQNIEIQQAEEEHTRLLKLLAETRRDKESDQEECRDKIQKMTDERDECKTPYSNLFKEHQQATDIIQKLQNDNKNFQASKSLLEKQIKILQNKPSVAAIVTPASMSKSFDRHQIQIPQNNKQILQPIAGAHGVTIKRSKIGSNAPLPVAAAPAAVSTVKSVNANQNFLEEPKLVGRQPIFLNGRDSRGAVNVPVGAEPPLAKHNRGEYAPHVHENHLLEEDAMEAPKAFKNSKNINYAQVNSHPSKLQQLEQPHQLNFVQNHGRSFHEENLEEDNEVDTGPRTTAQRRYSQNAQGLNILNLNRQIQQPLVLHPRVDHSGLGENLDQQVDNLDQDHPELQRPLDSGRLHDKYLEEEVENQMDDDVDGRLLNRQHFVDQNENKVIIIFQNNL